MKPFTLKQLSALENGNHAGLIKRLVDSCRKAMLELSETQEELQQIKGSELEGARPDREKAVLMIHADGYIEVFAEPWQSCRVVYLPEHDDESASEVEQKTIESLPIGHRDLIWANKVVASGNVLCCPTAEGIKQAKKVEHTQRLLERLEEAVTKVKLL
jgi:hypothetical protein